MNRFPHDLTLGDEWICDMFREIPDLAQRIRFSGC